MSLNYFELDHALGANAEVIHKDPRLGRMHDELVVEVKKAEDYFDRVDLGDLVVPFSRQPLSPAVRSKYEALKNEVKVRYKITLP